MKAYIQLDEISGIAYVYLSPDLNQDTTIPNLPGFWAEGTKGELKKIALDALRRQPNPAVNLEVNFQ